MRKILYMGAVVVTALCMKIGVVSAGGAESAFADHSHNKDECLLIAKKCPTPDYRLQERINRLKDEIDKGTAVYSQDELRILRRKLDDAKATQDFFQYEQPSQPLAY